MRAEMNLRFDWPSALTKYVKSDGLNVTLGVNITLQDGVHGPSFYSNEPFKLVVDWNSILDSVVVMGTNVVFQSAWTRTYIIHAWGVLKRQLSSWQTSINVKIGWITNAHDTNYDQFEVTIAVDTYVVGSRERLVSAAPSVDFEVLDHESFAGCG